MAFRSFHPGFREPMDWEAEPSADDAPSPFAGRVVRVELQRGATRAELARGALDEHGRAHFPLPVLGTLTVLARASSVLHAVPVDDDIRIGPASSTRLRFQNRFVRTASPTPSPSTSDVEMYLVVPAFLGGVVRGAAVGADGLPAKHAHVYVRGDGGASARDTCTDERGRFAFVVEAGGVFDVGVHAPDGSRARRKGVRLAAGVDADLGELRLVEDKVVFGGRITYPDGAPIENLAVGASHRHLDMMVSYMLPTLSCQTYGIQRSTRTDGSGRYRLFPGLIGKSDSWMVQAEFKGNARCKPGVWSPEGARTDLDAVMHGHRVRLLIQDEASKPVANARVTLVRLDELPADARRSRRDKKVAARTDQMGQAELFLTRGSRWEATVVATGADPLHDTVEVPTSGNESSREFLMSPTPRGSGVRVDLRSAEGVSLMPAVVNVSTMKGTDVWSRRVKDPSFLIPVGAGRYRVHIWSTERSRTASSQHRWQHHRGEIEVLAGKATMLEAVVEEAAHLQVTVRASEGLGERRGRLFPKVFLEHAETGERHDEFVAEPWQVGNRGGPGVKVVREDLTPGAWTVRFECSGFQTVTRTVELASGELGKIEFVLEKE